MLRAREAEGQFGTSRPSEIRPPHTTVGTCHGTWLRRGDPARGQRGGLRTEIAARDAGKPAAKILRAGALASRSPLQRNNSGRRDRESDDVCTDPRARHPRAEPSGLAAGGPDDKLRGDPRTSGRDEAVLQRHIRPEMVGSADRDGKAVTTRQNALSSRIAAHSPGERMARDPRLPLPRRARAQGAVALHLDDPQRQPSARRAATG